MGPYFAKFQEKFQSKIYNLCWLHDAFMQSIDIGHSKVANMRVLTPEKAKAKFFQLKNALLIVKRNWDKSRNRDGTDLC